MLTGSAATYGLPARYLPKIRQTSRRVARTIRESNDNRVRLADEKAEIKGVMFHNSAGPITRPVRSN